MGSKNHCQWPKNEPEVQTSSGRQLRSHIFQTCLNCNQPVQVKTGQQNVCECLSTPITLNDPTSSANQSKKRNRKTLQLPETCKRQLFDININTDDDQPKSTVVLAIPKEPTVTESGESSNISTQQLEVEQQMPVLSQMLRGRHVCQLCSKSFTSPCKLTQHSYTHTGEKPFVCKHCSKAFSSKFKLVRHVLIHSDQRQYHCTICDRTFHRKDHLKNHAKVHNPIKRTLQCDRPDCAKEYSSVLSYRKHIAVHSVEEGFLDCKICNKVFETKDEIMYHLKIHSGSRVVKTPADKKYSCNFCERSFYTGKDVRRHLVVHTGLRDFLCQFCPQRFGRKDHLTRHIKKSHNINATKKSKPKKPSEHQKTKLVETIYLETYGEPYKVERKVAETITSGSLIKQENSPMSEIQTFNSPNITSFNYSESNSHSIESKKSKPKKLSELQKNKLVETIYLETYGEPYKVERKVAETITSGSLIKQENSPMSEIQMFHSSNITSFNYSESNSQNIGSSSEADLPSISYEPQASYPVNELKVFDTTLTNQLTDNYRETTNPEISGLSQLIGLIPSSTNTNIQPSVLTSHESTILMSEPHQHIISQEQTQIPVSEYLTSSSEILSALLRQTSETGTIPLPGFNQVFHQQQ